MGPGPHDLVGPEVFLLNYGYDDLYNKKCEGFMHGKCIYWSTDKIPLECKIYVCQNRSFSESELENIKKLTGRN